jgi:uncharacterized protein (TIGR00251 family)
MAWHRWEGDDLVLSLRISPGSTRTGFADIFQDAMKLRLAAPPVDGQANKQLVTWLAKQFGVSKSAIRIESGTTSRLKRVRIVAPQKLPNTLTPSDT